MTDYKELLDQYYDGELTSEQEAELHDWLMKNPANIETFIYEGQLHSRLSMRSEAESFEERHGMPRRWWNSRALAVAATLMVLAGLCTSYYLYNSNIAVLTSFSGDVYVISSSKPADAFEGKRIYSGNQVLCRNGGSEATITCRDGSSLTLGPRTELSFSVSHGQYQSHLSSGSVSAVIKKQDNRRPFIISTKSAVATVLGTELSLFAGDSSTSMEVEKGLVRIMRLADGKKVEVPAGQSVVDAKDVEFEPVNWQWSDRFRGGDGSGGAGGEIKEVSLDNGWLENIKDKPDK